MAKKMSKGARAALFARLNKNLIAEAVPTASPKKVTVKRKAAVKTAPVKAKAPVKKTVARKPAAKTAGKDHWFHSMTKKQQAEYIKAHPRSIYAKKAAGAAKPSSAGKAKLDAIREELRALQAKKATMSPEAYRTKLATIKAKIAHASGTAKMPARKTTKKPARKPAVAKTKLHTKAEAAVKAHVAEKKKLKTQIDKLHARHVKAKASTTPKGKARAAELMKQKKALRAKHAAVHAKHTVSKARLKKHTEAHKAKAAKAKAKPAKKAPAKKSVKATQLKTSLSRKGAVSKARRGK